MKCNYTVPENHLYKVQWMKNGIKLFQFIRGRSMPFINFTIPGAKIDVSVHSTIYYDIKNLQYRGAKFIFISHKLRTYYTLCRVVLQHIVSWVDHFSCVGGKFGKYIPNDNGRLLESLQTKKPLPCLTIYLMQFIPLSNQETPK